MFFQDAQAYLLEQDGKLLQAFELMKTDLEDQISQLMSEKASENNSSALLMSKLNTTVILIIQLCQRSSLVNDIRYHLYITLALLAQYLIRLP